MVERELEWRGILVTRRGWRETWVEERNCVENAQRTQYIYYQRERFTRTVRVPQRFREYAGIRWRALAYAKIHGATKGHDKSYQLASDHAQVSSNECPASESQRHAPTATLWCTTGRVRQVAFRFIQLSGLVIYATNSVTGNR